jgi:hypothetical protein
MTTNDVLAIIVTLVGSTLCFIFMLFLFRGKRIPGDSGKPSVIKYKDLELTTNTLIMVLVVSAIVTVLPFAINTYLEKPDRPEAIDLFLTGRVEDESGLAIEGAVAKVTHIGLDGKTVELFSKNIESDGNFEFPIHLTRDAKIKLETEKPNYRKQSVIIQLEAVNFPSVLVKKGH